MSINQEYRERSQCPSRDELHEFTTGELALLAAIGKQIPGNLESGDNDHSVATNDGDVAKLSQDPLTLRIRCPHCLSDFAPSDEDRVGKMECPHCGGQFNLAADDAESKAGRKAVAHFEFGSSAEFVGRFRGMAA